MSTTTAAARLTAAEDRLVEMKAALANDLLNANATGEHFDSERIAKAANAIAAQEGTIRVRHLLASLEANGVGADGTAKALLRESLRGPDDQWSGRSNDVRRAFADGHRDAINDAMWDLP